MIGLRHRLALACCASLALHAATAAEWSALAPSPVGRFEGAAAVVDGKLYAFGGFAAGLGAQFAVHAFDPATGNWIARAPMLRAVTHSQAAVVGHRVYIAGGFEGANPGAAIADVQVYDTLTNTWSTTSVPDLPAPRASGALIALGSSIHYVAGLQANRCTDATEHWALDTTNPGAGWLARAPLPEGKNHFNGVAIDDRLYAVGGQHGHDCGLVNVASAHRYEPVTNTWSAIAAMPGERSHHEPSTFAWGRFVVVGGGTSNSAPTLASVVAYDTVRGVWRRWPDLPAARRAPILQRIGTSLVFATGGTGSNGIDATAAAQLNRVRADAPRVLFIRGADRSGGFLEATSGEQRTEQLADIENDDAAPGNHGWSELRSTLESEGFLPEQVAETAENASEATQGIAVPLQSLPLFDYALLVFGSNNAVYSPAAAQAVAGYVAAGGGALFVSDANFGSDWTDAPSSDQAFLGAFGVTMNQDEESYEATPGYFVVPSHPILAGINSFDGEGVSPGVRGTAPPGVSLSVIVRANAITRVNTPPFGAMNQGALRAVTANDATLLVGSVGAGRIATHFDRNTFFNANGAGTDITRLDNRSYAIQLFAWLAQGPPPPMFANGFE